MPRRTIISADLDPRPFCIDAAAPLVTPRSLPRLVPQLTAAGIDCVLATVASVEPPGPALDVLGRWLQASRDGSLSFRIAAAASEIRAAHEHGEFAVVLHFQGGSPFESNVHLVDAFHRLGVRVMQLTYNWRGLLGDGCLEPADAGLSALGRDVVRRMSELRVVLDVAHAGVRTSLDAIDMAEAPVVASHANARPICNHPRNLTDEQARAVAASGGVIGLCAFPAFVDDRNASVERLLDHAEYLADLVGSEHVGLGLDFADEDEEDFEYFRYDERFYPRPPWTYPDGIRSFADVPNITAGLLARGFAEDQVRGILGLNFLRVFSAVWGI